MATEVVRLPPMLKVRNALLLQSAARSLAQSVAGKPQTPDAHGRSNRMAVANQPPPVLTESPADFALICSPDLRKRRCSAFRQFGPFPFSTSQEFVSDDFRNRKTIVHFRARMSRG